MYICTHVCIRKHVFCIEQLIVILYIYVSICTYTWGRDIYQYNCELDLRVLILYLYGTVILAINRFVRSLKVHLMKNPGPNQKNSEYILKRSQYIPY